jgi:hypothetical protein
MSIPELFMIPLQLLKMYDENRDTSSRELETVADLSSRVSRKVYAVFGDVSWWSSAAVYTDAIEMRLEYHESCRGVNNLSAVK